MSFSLLKWLGHTDPQLKDIEFRTLFRLCWHCNETTLVCHPSVETLSKAMDCSPRTVSRALAALEGGGYIEVSRDRWPNSGLRMCNRYKILAAFEMEMPGGRKVRLDHRDEDVNAPIHMTPVSGGPDDNPDIVHMTPVSGEEHRRRNIEEEDSLPSEGGTRHDDDLFLTEQALEVRAPSLHEAVLTGWKAMSQQVPAIANIRGMDDSRKRAIAARGRDAVACGADSPQAGWSEIFAAVGRSSFLRGEAAPGKGRQTSFRLTLDFVLKPTNFRKILEGGYDDRHDARTSDPETGRHYGPAEQASRSALPGFLARQQERRGGTASG